MAADQMNGNFYKSGNIIITSWYVEGDFTNMLFF